MLIYNHKKEFVGIDQNKLNYFGFDTLSNLQQEVSDFADLFVKTPGYIHNFKNVHWIDYITCTGSSEESKVIINVNSRNFQASLSVSTFFLNDEPEKEAYLIELLNLRELTKEESLNISDDISAMPSPTIAETIEVTPPTTEKQEEIQQETKTPSTATEEISINETSESDLPLDVGNIMIDDEQQTSTEDTDDDSYVYDPHIASEQLGLPLDLIEEFIEDFINQAYEFKDDLYSSLKDGDIETLKTLAHKLKGVAANLRIEDALETLSIINTTSDLPVIETNLNRFYKIIAKLDGKESIEENNIKVEDEIEIVEEPKIEIQDEIEDQIEIVEEPQLEIIKDEVIYDKEQASKEIGIDLETFNELFEDYTIESKALVESIKNDIQNNNIDEYKQKALKLKSMSSNMRIFSFIDELNIISSSNDKQTIENALSAMQNKLNTIYNSKD